MTTVKKVMALLVRDDSTVHHPKNSSRSLGNRRVMSDQHHGATLLLLQANDEIENRMSVFAVEITGRFIRQQQRWPVSQTARDGDALSFAAGKFGREMIEPMLEADQL